MNSVSDTFFDNKYKIYATLFLATFVLYLKSVFYDFSPFDDQWLVLKNIDLISDWSKLKLVFSQALAGLYYRPILTLSFMIDYHIGEQSPLIYHLNNVILHCISVLLLYRLLKLFELNNKLAFLFSLLFAVHPIMLHAAAWIPGRNDLLLSVFALSSIIFLIRYLKEGKKSFLIFNILFFVLSLLTKENAFLLIIIYIQIYFIYNKFRKKIFSFGLIWLATVFAWFTLRNNIINHYPPIGTDLILYFKNFVLGFLIFIGKTLIPWKQSVFPTLNSPTIITGIIVCFIFIYLHLKLGLHNKNIAYTGLSVFFILLAIPVWYGATSSSHEHYEHRIHTAMFGLIIYVSQFKFNYSSKLFYSLFYLLIAVFSIKTFYRMDVYKTQMEFLNSGINEGTKYYYFYFQKGNLLYGDREFKESVDNFNKAIEIQPRRPQLFFNRGNAYAEMGKKDEAIADYNTAIKLEPNEPFMLVTRCRTFNRFNDLENAIVDLEQLKKCCPKDIPNQLEAEIIFKWNNSFFDRLNKQILAEPQNAILYVNRAKYFMDKRMGKEALEDLKKACEIDPMNEDYKRYYKELNSSFNRK